jgi:hypothetical protein
VHKEKDCPDVKKLAQITKKSDSKKLPMWRNLAQSGHPVDNVGVA